MADQRQQSEPEASTHSVGTEKIAGNVLALGSGEVVARLVAFIGTAYLAQVLGPAGFGVIGFALALCAYMSLAVSAGFGDIGTREVARRPHDARRLAAGATLVRLAMALLAFAVIGIAVCFLNKPPTVKLVVLLTGLSFFSLALDTSWVHNGLEQNRRVAVAKVLRQLLYVGLVLLVIRRAEDLLRIPVVLFISEAGAALWLGVSLFRLGAVIVDVREGLNILIRSLFVTLSKLLRTCIFTADIVLLGFLLGDREVGLYAAPYRFCFLLLAISGAIHISYRPAFTRAVAAGSSQLTQLVARSLGLASAIGAPLVAGGMVLSAPILLLLFGHEYLEGAAAFRFLILSIGILFINGAIHNLFVVCGGLKTEMWIIAVAATVNIALNLVLIPSHGLVGAAFATVMAEVLILLFGILAIYRMGQPLAFKPVLQPLLASGVMIAGLIALGPGRHLAIYLVVGMVVYCSVLTLLRGIPQDAMPALRKVASLAPFLLERCRRGWHFWTGPTEKQIDEARSALAGREYYCLFDDVYQEIQRHGGSQARDRRLATTREQVYADLGQLRRDGLLPEAGAKLIDLGCGDGVNAVCFARLGYQVTGVDISATAIDSATQFASKKDLKIEFHVADVLQLAGIEESSFDIATDIGCLHMLVRDEHRRRYLHSVRRILRPGAVFFVFTHVSSKDVEIADEDSYIQRMITWSDKRWMGDDGTRLKYRMCGFRDASMRQYEYELRAAGFDILRTRPGRGRHLPFAMLLARRP